MTTATKTCQVAVNYDQSIEELIQAGKYDWRRDNVVDGHFAPEEKQGLVEVEIELVHLGRGSDICTDDVLREFERRELRPATPIEVLAFGAAYPDIQRRFPFIVALGHPWQGRSKRGRPIRAVLCLEATYPERGVALGLYDADWTDICWFAAVRVIS